MREDAGSLKEWVFTHPKYGLFVGLSMGMSFWSFMDNANQTAVPSFESKKQAKDFISTWSPPVNNPDDYRFVEVVIEESGRATYEELCKAGLSTEAAPLNPLYQGMSGTA